MSYMTSGCDAFPVFLTNHVSHVEYSEPPPAAFTLVFVEIDVSVVKTSYHFKSKPNLSHSGLGLRMEALPP